MKLQKIILSIAIIIIPFTSFADKTTATIQRNLNLLGYNAGPVDGAYGKKTRLALEQFYKDNGGLFDGKTDDNEIIDLTKALALNSGCNSSDLYETTSEISDKKFSLFGSKVRNTKIPKYLKNTTGEITSDIGNVYAHIQLVDDFNNDGIDDLLIDYNSTLVAPLILYGQKSGSFKILD
jgi:peptidoglycan hydrolase-like protein with peptidoglycan-binding domain